MRLTASSCEKWLYVALLIGLAGVAGDASTFDVCNPNVRCFAIDTTVIGGRRLEDYRVTDSSSPLVNVGARRAVLQADRNVSTQYCSINPYIAALPSLPSVGARLSSLHIFMYSGVNGSGQPTLTQEAEFDLQDVTTSEGYSLPRFGFYFVQDVGGSQISLQFRTQLLGIPGVGNIGIVADRQTRVASQPESRGGA